jgi:methyl-accepting chemotaxis protein
MQIRTKLFLAFFIIVFVCSAAALAVTLGGYDLVVREIVSSADSNDSRVSEIAGMMDMVNLQQNIAADCVIKYDASELDRVKEIGTQLSQSIEKLKEQSADSEKAELTKLEELNKQTEAVLTDVLAKAVVGSDRTEYDSLLSEYEKQYIELLDKEQELERSIRKQAAGCVMSILNGKEKLEELNSQQIATIEALVPSIEKILSQYEKLIRENKSTLDANEALRLEIDRLNEEIEKLSTKEAQRGEDDDTANITDGRQIWLTQGQETSRSAETVAYDADMVAAVKTYIDELPKYSADYSKKLEAMQVMQLSGMLSRLDDIDNIISTTRMAYSEGSSLLSGESGNADEYSKLIEDAEHLLRQLQKRLSGNNAQLADEAAKGCAAISDTLKKLLACDKAIKNSGLLNSYEDAVNLFENEKASLSKLDKAYRSYLAEDVVKSEQLKSTLLLILIGVVVLSLIIGVVSALLLSKNISLPIRKITRLLEKVGNGDLSERVYGKRDDEIGKLGEKVNVVLDEQQMMLRQVKATSNDIGKLKKELTGLFEYSKESAGRMSAGLKNIMDGLTENEVNIDSKEAEYVQDGGENELAVTADKAVADGMRVIEIAATGKRSVQEAEAVIRNATDTVKQIADSISELEESSSRIGDITNTITDIAAKTNLLALNAAIEAARAGQQGKGFTVLAEEIRKLSNGSNKAAEQIKNIIKEIQDRIQFAVDKITNGVSSVDAGAGKIDDARNSILNIAEAVNQITDTLREAADAVRSRQDNTTALAAAIDALSKTAARTAESGAEIDAGLEVHIKTIEQLNDMTGKLDEVSITLNNIVERFKI